MSKEEASDLDVEHPDWPKERRFIGKVITDGRSEVVLAIMVLCSLALIIVEADHKARDEETPYWIKYVENILLLLYSIEMVLRLYVFRKEFFETPLNIVDLLVVVIDAAFFFVRLASIELPKLTFLRVLRLAKLSRAFHILLSQEPLYIMCEAFLASLKTLFFGCMFIAVALVIYGIIAVEFMRPLDVEFSPTCTVCPVAFTSVYRAMLALIQTNIVADEWGDLFLPFLLKHPQTLVFILTVFVTVNFGLMNLIMAVIVDSAAQARIHNTKRIAEERDKEFKAHQKNLQKLCREMDSDGSQSITVNELMTAFDTNLEFKVTLHAMDIDREDLEAVFNILDDDGSGDVAYDEFVQQLYKMKTNNSSTMLVFIKHYITEVRKNVGLELDILKDQLAGGIAELHGQVSEELRLVKNDIKVHLQETVAPAVGSRLTTPQKEIGISKEAENLVKDDLVFNSQAAAAPSAEKIGEQIAFALQDLRWKCETEGPLQIAMAQITVALEDLKHNCENSVVLLSAFHGLLPPAARHATSSPRYDKSGRLAMHDNKVPLLQLPSRSTEDLAPQKQPRVNTVRDFEPRESRGCISTV